MEESSYSVWLPCDFESVVRVAVEQGSPHVLLKFGLELEHAKEVMLEYTKRNSEEVPYASCSNDSYQSLADR